MGKLTRVTLKLKPFSGKTNEARFFSLFNIWVTELIAVFYVGNRACDAHRTLENLSAIVITQMGNDLPSFFFRKNLF